MAGSREGGIKTRDRLKAQDPDYYRRIGQIGGKLSKTGGFGNGEVGRKLAMVAGAKGGRISRRPKRQT